MESYYSRKGSEKSQYQYTFTHAEKVMAQAILVCDDLFAKEMTLKAKIETLLETAKNLKVLLQKNAENKIEKGTLIDTLYQSLPMEKFTYLDLLINYNENSDPTAFSKLIDTIKAYKDFYFEDDTPNFKKEDDKYEMREFYEEIQSIAERTQKDLLLNSPTPIREDMDAIPDDLLDPDEESIHGAFKRFKAGFKSLTKMLNCLDIVEKAIEHLTARNLDNFTPPMGRDVEVDKDLQLYFSKYHTFFVQRKIEKKQEKDEQKSPSFKD